MFTLTGEQVDDEFGEIYGSDLREEPRRHVGTIRQETLDCELSRAPLPLKASHKLGTGDRMSGPATFHGAAALRFLFPVVKLRFLCPEQRRTFHPNRRLLF